MDDQAEEKEFAPTPQKLEDARKKGEIAKSADLNTAAAYLGFLVGLYFVFETAIIELGDLFIATIELSTFADRLTETASASAALGGLVSEVSIVLAPVFAVPATFVILSILVQRSFVVAPTKIQPKLNRISPISGLKNKFGRAGLFEFFKSFVKLALFMGVLAIFVQVNFDQIAIANQLSPGASLLNMASLLYTFLFVIFSLAILIGLIDFAFQHAEHQRKNRMSRKDLQDEVKNAEGDPMLKQRRRQKALALASGQMADVPDASVIMVNPTHYAVALKWDPLEASAPIIVAKGADEVASRIRELADFHGIPIHSDPPATRALFAVTEIGDPVPQDQYKAVAEAIRFAEGLRQKRAKIYGT